MLGQETASRKWVRIGLGLVVATMAYNTRSGASACHHRMCRSQWYQVSPSNDGERVFRCGHAVYAARRLGAIKKQLKLFFFTIKMTD